MAGDPTIGGHPDESTTGVKPAPAPGEPDLGGHPDEDTRIVRPPTAPREWSRLIRAIGQIVPRDLERTRLERAKLRRIARK